MIAKLLKECAVLLYGLFMLGLLMVGLTISLPLHVYRWIISMAAKHLYKGKIGKPVTAFGNMFAVDILPSSLHHPPRCSVVITMAFDGKITAREVTELCNTRLFDLQNVRYPELMQYVESWMGFMFWKNDIEFSVENHILSHSINCATDEEMEERVCQFVEDLLNKPFHKKRSPWEGFVIENYKNEKLKARCVNQDMTLIIFRFHHCLGDGYSVLYGLIEGLLGTPLSSIPLPSPENLRLNSQWKKFMFALSFPVRLVQDLARYCLLPFSPKTPFHISDGKKAWRQLYARSAPIPIEHIRNIKVKHGVTFTGVLLSALSAGLAKSIQSMTTAEEHYKKYVPIATVLPLPGHPNKLRNHFTITYFHMPSSMELSSLKRLEQVEWMLKKAKRNTFPLIFLAAIKSFVPLFLPLTKFLFKNRHFHAGLTNFPGPGMQMDLNCKRCLAGDFAVGCHTGVMGIEFMMLSYQDHLRIAVVVEEAIMSRTAANELLTQICEELEILNRIQETEKSGLGPDRSTPSIV